MSRGGKRDGAGGKPTWNYGKTKPVRVPVALADRILEIARVLDEGGAGESVVGSKVLDLTGIAVHASTSGPTVRLADLLRAGYEIRPERLVRSLKDASMNVSREAFSFDTELNCLIEGKHE
jgi:hypothetical protein